MSPRRTVLLRQMPVSFCHFIRLYQTVLSTLRLAHLLKGLGPQHFAERIRRINRSINYNVRHMDILRAILCIQGPVSYTHLTLPTTPYV